MKLTKKQTTIKYCVYCAVLLLADIMQNVSGLWFEIGSARCFFLIPAAVSLGIDEDENISAALGFFAGLLWDASSARHMGFNCIFLMIMCYLLSSLVSYIFRPTFWICFISSCIVSFSYCLIYWLLFMVISHSEGSAASLGYFYIPCAVYTCIVSFFICIVINPLKKRLNNQGKNNG